MAPDSSPDRIRIATATLDRVRAGWLRHPGVTAVDVGAGDRPGDPVLRVHVEDQRAASEVAGAFPAQVDGFAVRIIEARYGLQDGGGAPP